MSHALHVTLVNRTSEVGRLVELLESFGADAGLSSDLTFRLTLALDEIVSNVIRHGFDDSLEHAIEVQLTVHDGVVTATVEDDAVAYDPRETPPPNLDAPIEERTPGGLGMHLVRATMDEIAYRREGGRNILTVKASSREGDV